jgi:hypothetical protein
MFTNRALNQPDRAYWRVAQAHTTARFRCKNFLPQVARPSQRENSRASGLVIEAPPLCVAVNLLTRNAGLLIPRNLFLIQHEKKRKAT